MSIAVIGAGAMGEALIAGWLAAGHSDIRIVDSDALRVAELEERLGVCGTEVAEAAGADIVVLAVKPHQVDDLLACLRDHLGAGTLVVSIAAGVPLSQLAAGLPKDQPVIRVMPNTPALLGQGMAGVVAGPKATDSHLDQVVSLMDAVGESVVIAESAIDALTSLSGSGPAYLFLVAEAMIEAGVHQGLTRPQATVLVNQTFVGSAAMLAESGRSATVLREQVTSPAGTTAAALRALEDHGVRAAFLSAVEACADRSRELGQG